MLDAIVAATEHAGGHLHRRQRDDRAARPPAVPLGSCSTPSTTPADGARRPRAASRHPLQPFDRRNLDAAAALLLRPAGPGRCARRGGLAPGRPGPSWPTSTLPRARRATSSSRTWSSFLKHPVQEFLRSASTSPCPTRREEVTDGHAGRARRPRSSGASATGCCVTCSPGAPPTAPSTKEWRRGVLPAGPARLASWPADRRPGDAGRRAWPPLGAQAAAPRPVDVDVDLGDGRRLRGTVTGRLRRPAGARRASRGSVPALARGLGAAARPVRPDRPRVRRGRGRRGADRSRGDADRAGRPGRPSPRSTAPATCCVTWWRLRRAACPSRCRCR